MMMLTILPVAVLLLLCTSLTAAKAAEKDFTLTILHTNDVHSRFLQASKNSGPCSPKEEAANKCYGGFARLHYKVKEIRSQISNVAYLSGGDYYQGTVWYTIFKWRVVSKFVNLLNHTAMALGNHEFDDGIEGLIPFMDAATFPIVVANIDDKDEPLIQGKLKKSHVVEYDGVKVGIIGYTTTETMAISSPGKLQFKDEVESVKTEAERLHSTGVKALIAVGHAGYDVDMKIAKEVPLIDVVVGGHTNTFLYHGDHPDVEQPMGDYPTIVEQSSGRKVPVVQAYAFGKYLGYLNVTFNADGEVTKWAGNPILLDGSVPQDEDLLVELKKVYQNLTQNLKEEIGKTHVFLNGSNLECRLRECNLGSLITDAMVWANLRYPDEIYWSDVTIAILNGGGVRASIDERSKNGSISVEDILTVMPFQNTIDLIEVKGKTLLDAFEFAVKGYDSQGHHLPGKFLQVSGLRVTYDITQPEGSRVKSLQALCSACRVPQFVPIDPEAEYKVAVPTYIANGGDGFTMIRDNILKRHENGILDSEMLIKYVKARSPIIQGVEGRIQFYGATASGAIASHGESSLAFVLLAFIVLLNTYRRS